MANSSSSSDMVVLSCHSQVTFEHRRATFTPPYRHAIVHLAREHRGGGGQFISGADRIFQRKPEINYMVRGDHIFQGIIYFVTGPYKSMEHPFGKGGVESFRLATLGRGSIEPLRATSDQKSLLN